LIKETYHSENSTLGRKSNRKKAAQALQPAKEAKLNRLGQIAHLSLISGLAFLFWGIHLFEKTFISLQTQYFILLFGAIVGFVVFGRHLKYGLTVTLCYGIFVGAPIPYGILATTNYYFRDNKTEKVQLDILESGYRSKGKSNCKAPYVQVEFDNINKEIDFGCGFEVSIAKYKSLTFTVSKGLWGYTVYTNRFLND
jgi:hypothetical protein